MTILDSQYSELGPQDRSAFRQGLYASKELNLPGQLAPSPDDRQEILEKQSILSLERLTQSLKDILRQNIPNKKEREIFSAMAKQVEKILKGKRQDKEEEIMIFIETPQKPKSALRNEEKTTKKVTWQNDLYSLQDTSPLLTEAERLIRVLASFDPKNECAIIQSYTQTLNSDFLTNMESLRKYVQDLEKEVTIQENKRKAGKLIQDLALLTYEHSEEQQNLMRESYQSTLNNADAKDYPAFITSLEKQIAEKKPRICNFIGSMFYSNDAAPTPAESKPAPTTPAPGNAPG